MRTKLSEATERRIGGMVEHLVSIDASRYALAAGLIAMIREEVNNDYNQVIKGLDKNHSVSEVQVTPSVDHAILEVNAFLMAMMSGEASEVTVMLVPEDKGRGMQRPPVSLFLKFSNNRVDVNSVIE